MVVSPVHAGDGRFHVHSNIETGSKVDRHCFVSWVASSPSLFSQKPISVPFCRLVSTKAHVRGILDGRATSLVLSLASASSRRRRSGSRSWDGPKGGRLLAFCGGHLLLLMVIPPIITPSAAHAIHGPCGFPWHCKQPALPMGKMEKTLARLDAVTFEMRVTFDQIRHSYLNPTLPS